MYIIAGQREILIFIKEKGVRDMEEILIQFSINRKNLCTKITHLKKFKLVDQYKEGNKWKIKAL